MCVIRVCDLKFEFSVTANVPASEAMSPLPCDGWLQNVCFLVIPFSMPDFSLLSIGKISNSGFFFFFCQLNWFKIV